MYALKVLLHGREIQELSLESGREYIFGRGADCAFRLEDQPGISRTHFRVFEDAGIWKAEVLSKFGEIISAGQPVQTVALEVNSVFKLADYNFRLVEANSQEQQEEDVYAAASGDGEPASRRSVSSHLPALVGFDGNDEATKIISTSNGVPYARIVEGSGEENTILLKGKRWIAGREGTCDVLLDDRKSSRRQFELTSSPQGYFVRDLGSANGTMLNGTLLAADELKPIRSGDLIQVGQAAVHFEVRDPNFQKKLLVVAPHILQPPQMPAMQEIAPPPQQATYEIINFPVSSGPGGAIRLPSAYDGAQNVHVYDLPQFGNPEIEARRKKIRFYLVLAIVLIPLLWFLNNSKTVAPQKVATKLAPLNDAFSRLSPQNQQKVKEIFVLGKNLFLQGKHALAAEQLRKLHEIIPEGYENSLAIAEECRAQANQAENLLAIEKDRKQAEERRLIVDKNLRDCQKLAGITFNVDELKSCLAPTYERDPTNPVASSYVEQVELRLTARADKEKQHQEYVTRVSRGRALFEHAQAIEKKGEIFDAIEAYKKHIASSFPDPAGLKSRSAANIESIRGRVGSQVSEQLTAAQADFAAKRYRSAIDHILAAKAADPKNDDVVELHARIRHEVDDQMRAIYEDSIVDEGLGALERAKEHWKKIKATDHPEGTYYKRARSKLQSYGDTSP